MTSDIETSDSLRPPEPEWILLGLTFLGDDPRDVGWIGLFRVMTPDATGALRPRTWRDYRAMFYPFPQCVEIHPHAEIDLSWLGPWVTAGAAEALAALIAPGEAHEGTAEARHDAPPPTQAGPTRPGGTTPADSVTVGRDRHNFPDGTGSFSALTSNEERGQPMLLWRGGDLSVRRIPHAAARLLGPCPPVYFCSLAPYRPNRAERPSAGSLEPVGGDFPS